MLLAEKSKQDLTHVKNLLRREFDMKDMGEASKILGIEILRDKEQSSLSINQLSYCEKVLKRFNLNNARPITLPIAQYFKLSSANSPKDSDLEHQYQMSS